MHEMHSHMFSMILSVGLLLSAHSAGGADTPYAVVVDTTMELVADGPFEPIWV